MKAKLKISIAPVDKEEFYDFLQMAKFKLNCQSWLEYERAKRIISYDKQIDSVRYKEKINWITEYLNV
jgi:hypothetical protein